MSLWNTWGHITTVPACSSGILTNVLPHRNAMPQTQDTTPHPVTVYRHGADLSLCYPLMWNVTLEYTATHFNVLGETRPGNPSPTFHTHQRTLNLMLSWWSTVGSSVESTVPTGSWTLYKSAIARIMAERYVDTQMSRERAKNIYIKEEKEKTTPFNMNLWMRFQTWPIV